MALQLHNLRLSHIDIKIAISFLTVTTVSGLMFQLKAKELSDDPSFKAFYGWYEKWKRHHLGQHANKNNSWHNDCLPMRQPCISSSHQTKHWNSMGANRNQ